MAYYALVYPFNTSPKYDFNRAVTQPFLVEMAGNGKPPYKLYGGHCPTAHCALERDLLRMERRRWIVAVPYADYGILSPMVAIPNPCRHRWAAILHTFALLMFKFVDSFFHTTGTRLAKMCDTQNFSISELQRGRRPAAYNFNGS